MRAGRPASHYVPDDRPGVPDGGQPGLGALAGTGPGVADRLRASFATGLTRPVEWRRQQLSNLVRMLRDDAGTLTDAMASDLGKPELEAWLTDIAAVRRDIEGIVRHLDGWAAPRRARVPWTLWPGRAETVPEPLGAVLVIGPWNYPVRCLVLPLAFALAAGNTAAVKPSELAPATSAALAKLLASYLDGAAVTVAEGGPDVARTLLDQRWDHIFFTGSGQVGRLVMAAAAQHLTPVTLELGGKTRPSSTARATWASWPGAWPGGSSSTPGRRAWPRTTPSWPGRQRAPCCRRWPAGCRGFYGDGPAPPGPGPGGQRRPHGQAGAPTGVHPGPGGGRRHLDGPSRYFAPTVVADVGWDDPLMQEDIFGPILPIVAYDDVGRGPGRATGGTSPSPYISIRETPASSTRS